MEKIFKFIFTVYTVFDSFSFKLKKMKIRSAGIEDLKFGRRIACFEWVSKQTNKLKKGVILQIVLSNHHKFHIRVYTSNDTRPSFY